MKVLVVLSLVLGATATALAFGYPAAGGGAAAAYPGTEPTALLLSGTALIGVAGALRRLPL